MHGTILHEDALLSRLMRSDSCLSKLFKAHRGFDDFTDILWPEQFPEERLKLYRQRFIDNGDAAGYSQEYLNDPFDHSERFLRKNDFMRMIEVDYERDKVMAVGCDFAVSTKEKANRTSFTIGGKGSDNIIYFVDQYTGRWDTLEWINIMFDIQRKWKPQWFFVEGGVIWNSISPTIFSEMRSRDEWLNCVVINPTKEKSVRGVPFQKRMRAGGCRFDKQAEWYPGFETELLRFTGRGEAIADDQFDSAALLVKGFEDTVDVEDDDFLTEDEWDLSRRPPQRDEGRSAITGY